MRLMRGSVPLFTTILSREYTSDNLTSKWPPGQAGKEDRGSFALHACELIGEE